MGFVEEVKLCGKCGEVKVRRERTNGRVEYVCKPCHNKQNTKYKSENKEKIAEARKVYKKELWERTKNDPQLMEAKIACDKAHYQKYREKRLVEAAEYRQSLTDEQKVRLNELAKLSQKENPNRPLVRSRWKQSNKHSVNASTAERFAKKLKATPRWANKDLIKLVYASVIGSEHVDHIVPLRSWLVQGFHCESNLQVLNSSDNIAKGNRWWPEMPSYSEQDLHELKYYKWLSENALDNSPKQC